MANPGTIIHGAVAAALAEHGMTMLMAATARRHGGGGLERNAKASAQSRHEDGEVRSEPELLKKLTAPLRRLLKSICIDPARSNAAVVAFKAEDGVRVSLVIVHPGDIDKDQFVSMEAYTEAEYFRIANGPDPKRYPYRKMPQPIGLVVEIRQDGTLGERHETVPPHMEWVDAPVDWNAMAGRPAEMTLPEGVSGKDYDGALKAWRKTDPFVRDVLQAVAMELPGLRDIRRIGVDNGHRDGRGNVVD